MKKLYFLLLILIAVIAAQAQSSSNYVFTTDANGSLVLDKNGNAIDVSAATNLIATDFTSTNSSLQAIGFDFYFMGKLYTHYIAGNDGVVGLGVSTSPTSILGTTTANDLTRSTFAYPPAGTDNAAVLAAFWDDLRTARAGATVRAVVVGTAPNRTLVIQYNAVVNTTSTTATDPADAQFQVRLYETTGEIEYAYGKMTIGPASGTVTASIGFSAGATDNTFMAISNLSTYATTTIAANEPATQTLVNSSVGGNISGLHSPTEGSRRVFRFTPPVLPAATNLTFTSVSAGSMTLNWTDNATNEVGYVISRSTDNVTFTTIATTAANATSYTVTGLTGGGTTYYYKVQTLSEGSVSAPLSGSQPTANGTLTGTKTVGTGGDYLNLTTAFADINTNGLASNITLQLIAGYPASPETYPIQSSNAVVGSFSVTIYPTISGLAITSNNAAGTLQMNGARNIFIDGRVNATGTTKDLVIENTSTTGYAVQFINDAVGNTINYSIVRGMSAAATTGVVSFSTTTGGLGNSNNTISNNDLKDATATPANIVYSSGTVAFPNTNNTITANNIYNFFQAGAVDAAGVRLETGSTNWTITNNSFYQTAIRTSTAGATGRAIYVNNSAGNGFTINGNFVGGNATGATGTWTNAGAFANRFVGIHIVAGTTTATTVQNNTVRNFSFTSTSGATTEPGVWAAISLAGSIDATGNTIGAATGTGSVSVTSTTTGAISYGIVVSGGTGSTVNVTGNTIGSVTALGSTTSIGHSFRAISNTTAGTISISNNTIGSTTTANSINLSTATGGTIVQEFTAIRNTSSLPILSISGNVIANINNATTSTSGSSLTRGIVSSAGIATIRANTIRNITSSSAGVGTGASAAVSGISYTATTAGNHVISENIIHSLVNTAASSASQVIGIHYAGATAGANFVDRNFIHSLSLASTSATAALIGINASSGFAYYQNNMVRLGIDAAGASLTNGIIIAGIDKASSTADYFYHNTVYIGGQNVASNAANSFAFRRTATPSGSADSIYNNIFVNNRSNTGSTGKHYAISLNSNSLALIDYNLYNGTGAGFIFGYVGTPGTTDYTTFADWKTANPAFDANSKFANPLFVNANGDASTVDLHLTTGSPAEGSGLNIPSVINDFDGETRSALTPTDIGADAGIYGFAGTDVGITSLVSPASSTCYTNAEQVSVTLKNFSSNPIDFSTNNVTVTVTASGAGTYNSSTTLTTGTLAAGASINVVLPATFNMTAQGTYQFDASATVASGSADVNPANNAISVSRTNNVFGGNYLVGVGETYPTLTAAVAAYNAATCLSGPVTLSLKDATYTSETFPIIINRVNSASSTNTLTIKPAAGVAVVMSGTSGTTASSLIQLNGAHYVMIDGVNSGGSSLLFENTSTTAGTAVLWLSSMGAGKGAANNTIKNVTLKGGVAQNTATTVTYGLVLAGSTLATTAASVAAGEDNDNNLLDSNKIIKVRYAILTRGGSAANPNVGTVITNNIIGPDAFGVDAIGKSGVVAREEDGVIIRRNEIRFVGGTYSTTSGGGDRVGIVLGTDAAWTTTAALVRNAVVTKNVLHDIVDERAFSAVGISVAGADGTNATNNVIANNMIYNVLANGTGSDQAIGIGLVAGNGDKVVFNSINFNGDTDPDAAATTPTVSNFGLSINSTSVTNPVVRNNIVVMDLTSSSASTIKNAAVNIPASFVWGTGSSNYNDYYAPASNTQSNVGAVGDNGGTFYSTLSTWRTATSQDANSLSVDPLFVSATDLHLQSTSPVKNVGVAVAGVTDDYDSENRDANPDMGADELMNTVPVTFTAINAYQQNAGVQVDWNILTEMNVSRYEVEKSTDGRTFTTAGMVQARNAGTYKWYDAAPVSGNNYYRVKAVNVNGLAQFTSVAKVYIGKGASAISVYPNPVKGEVLNLQFINLSKGTYTVSISNQVGQKVFTQVISHNGGSANQAININNKLAAGIYQLHVIGQDVQYAQTIMRQ
jgi:hypothetical protein